MTTTTPAPAVPTLDQLLTQLAPSDGWTRVPCGEHVPDDQDAVTAHQDECAECQLELVSR